MRLSKASAPEGRIRRWNKGRLGVSFLRGVRMTGHRVTDVEMARLEVELSASNLRFWRESDIERGPGVASAFLSAWINFRIKARTGRIQ